MKAFGNCVGQRRAAIGLRQQELAARVGVSRQSLSVLEAGRSVPSAALALRLARELGVKVDDLFWLDDPSAPLTVELAADAPATSPAAKRDGRVVLAAIDGKWVAHRLTAADATSFLTAADGLITGGARGSRGTARVMPFDGERAARDVLLCAGCAPAFGILAARASTRRSGDRVVWLERSSGEALELLSRGHVHVAGAHLYDEEAHEFNVPFVQRRFPERSMLIYNLARWEVGLVVAAGNPKRIRGVADLARPGVAFAGRQTGAAAQDLVDRLLPPGARLRTAVTARGHSEVGRLVSLGVADAGVSLPPIARAHGLDFIPLAEERFDLVLAKELAIDGRIARLLETLSGRGFRRELETLGGHVTKDAGRLIAETGAPQ